MSKFTPKMFYEIDSRDQCYKNTAVIYHVKLPQYKTLLFLGLKYCGNLLSYCSYLLSLQGKFNVINIPMVIYCHSTDLVDKWIRGMRKLATAIPGEKIIGEVNRAYTILRDMLNESFDSIIVDDKLLYTVIKQYIHTITKVMLLYNTE